MRHKSGYRKLGRESSHRKAMLRNLATSFITEGAITTTVPKAKELKPIVEKLITLTHKSDLQQRKKLLLFFTKEARVNLFTSLAERFKERPGGYTRIIRLGNRQSDCAAMCRLELVDFLENEGKAKKREKRCSSGA